MNLDTLPRELITRCFSYLSTYLLTEIILLENTPDHIFEAAANNLNNLWYSKRIRSVEKDQVEGFEGSDGIEPYYETDFDQFLRIHKIFEEKSFKRPLWFHYTWNNIVEMHENLNEINLVYNGQSLGIHVYLEDRAFQFYPIFSDYDINLKITESFAKHG